MPIAFLSAVRPAIVAALPSGVQGDTVVLASDGHLYTHDGSGWVDNGSGGSGGASGLTTVDFGDGAPDAEVVITGQTGILAGSKVQAWIQAVDTADHTADDHWFEEFKVVAGSIVPGTGFTIYVVTDGVTHGEWTVGWRWE